MYEPDTRNDWRKRRRNSAIVFWSVVTVLGLVAVAFIGKGVAMYNTWKCDEQADAMGLESRWAMGTDCVVEVREGVWVDIDKIRVVEGGIVAD